MAIARRERDVEKLVQAGCGPEPARRHPTVVPTTLFSTSGIFGMTPPELGREPFRECLQTGTQAPLSQQMIDESFSTRARRQLLENGILVSRARSSRQAIPSFSGL
jgi:hypothetical protein